MKFGVFLPSHGPAKSPQAVKQVAQAAEQAGFDSLWAADHVLVHERFSDFCMIETFVTLGYVAAVTETITLGTTVLVLPQRDPILAAKQAAAVDQYSDGRLILGIGVGWMEDEYRYLRTDFSQRGRMMDEWIDVMRVLWSEEQPAFQGEWISFEESAFEPKPAQEGWSPAHDRRAERRGNPSRRDQRARLAADPNRAGAGRRRCRKAARLDGRRAAHGNLPCPRRTRRPGGSGSVPDQRVDVLHQ